MALKVPPASGASDQLDWRLQPVLAGAKAFVEYGIELNLVADRNPDAHVGS